MRAGVDCCDRGPGLDAEVATEIVVSLVRDLNSGSSNGRMEATRVLQELTTWCAGRKSYPLVPAGSLGRASFLNATPTAGPTKPFLRALPIAKPGDLFLSRTKYLLIVLTAAVLPAVSVRAGSANGSRPGGLSAVFSVDIPDAPSVLAVGDFNGDGVADVVETTPLDGEHSDLHSLTVLLGRADGTFLRVVSRDLIGRNPRALVVGDFNDDGKLDVIVGDADGTLLEFLGDGKGNLIRSGRIATVGSVASIAVGHFTRDGNLDLAVSDLESNSAVVLLGAGDGSFRQSWSFPLPQMGKEFHIAAADFNHDGVADLVITSEDEGNYVVMLGNGNGTFTFSPKLSHLKDPNSYCPT